MKIEIRQTKSEGIIQITSLDERWYQVGDEFYPSSTWIAGYYPKGIAFMKWLASKGWDEAEALKNAGGNRGSKVHQAVDKLLRGEEVKMDSHFIVDGKDEELTVEDWECVMSFADWHRLENPKQIILNESVVVSKKFKYAGTLDLFYEKRDGRKSILDIKTSSSIWPEMELQLSSYKNAVEESGQKVDCMEILQLNYKLNRAKFKVTEIEDKFVLFRAARAIWENENKSVVPKQKDYPVAIKL